MAFLYSATNLITVITLDSVLTEDPVYVKEYLYDDRPSRPFRFLAKAAQWIKIDLGAPTLVTLAAFFNHNITAGVVRIQSYSDAWTTMVYNGLFTWRANDMYHLLSDSNRWWRFYVNAPANPLMPQVGDAWLGTWSKFTTAHLQPGRDDGVQFFTDEQTTPYGQDWDAYLSESKRFGIRFMNLQDPANVDALEAFLSSIGGPAGRFVIIPDHTKPHVYMVKVVGSPSAHRHIYGSKELREWTLELKVLTRGITLL